MDGGTLTGFTIVPYRPEHLRAIALQPSQAELGAFLKQGDFAEKVSLVGPAWTALVNGVPVACAGFEVHWSGRSGCWAVLSEDAGKHMLRLTRAVKRALEIHPAERIEADVRVGFEAGHRWLLALGFEDDGLRKRYHKGTDHRAYVLLKNTL